MANLIPCRPGTRTCQAPSSAPRKVQKTYEKTLDSAHETYDSEQAAHRVAWAAVKHVAEKQGDHWELKDELVDGLRRSNDRATRRARS